MTKKTRRKIDVALRSVAIASKISGSLYGTCRTPCTFQMRRPFPSMRRCTKVFGR
jgi:hypothetical protein